MYKSIHKISYLCKNKIIVNITTFFSIFFVCSENSCTFASAFAQKVEYEAFFYEFFERVT